MNTIRLSMLGVVAVAATLWGCSEANSGPHVARLSVSESGFSPLSVEARRGQPLTLLVTRVSEASCAKEIMIPAARIRRSLPAHQEVTITFTPMERGSMQYTCCDDMAGGTINVR